jgi:hypothetical protein
MKEQLVHVPELALECGCLGCGRCCESVRVDLFQREMPEGEPNPIAEFALDPFDRAKRLPRVGAFVVAVFDDETSGRWARTWSISSSSGSMVGSRFSGIAFRLSEPDRPPDEDDMDGVRK